MARLIESTLGHTQQISTLIKMHESGRLAHALLFVGPGGVGKKRVGLALAQSLVCENKTDVCGHCGPCLRIEKQQSESLYVLSPDTEGAKPGIKVEPVRELLASLSLAKLGAARVVIIDSVNLMTAQAQNTLLKNLEEPTENLYFILIAEEVESLLPTIKSRTQIIRFGGLSQEHLRRLMPNLPSWAYAGARGQLDRLVQLTSKEGLSERQEALDLFSEFCFNEEFLLHDEWRRPLRDDRERAQFNMKCWLQIVRDALVLKTQPMPVIFNTDQTDLLKKLQSLSLNKLIWFSRELILAARDVNAYQDASLIVDSLRVKYARVD